MAVDLDVSPFDNSKTKKEGISWTYKKFDGYAPIFAYVGEEGYLTNLELRPGSDHCQKGTETFLRRTLRYARLMSKATFLVRMDSGNDSLGNIKVCRQEKAHYIIKRNLRWETPEGVVADSQGVWSDGGTTAGQAGVDGGAVYRKAGD